MRQRSVPGVVKSTRRLAPSKLLPSDDRRAIEDATVASSWNSHREREGQAGIRCGDLRAVSTGRAGGEGAHPERIVCGHGVPPEGGDPAPEPPGARRRTAGRQRPVRYAASTMPTGSPPILPGRSRCSSPTRASSGRSSRRRRSRAITLRSSLGRAGEARAARHDVVDLLALMIHRKKVAERFEAALYQNINLYVVSIKPLRPQQGKVVAGEEVLY